MRGHRDYLGGLTRLHLLDNVEDQRGTWRQSMATLALAVADNQGVPLEGFSPDALLTSLRTAFNSNLIDDLDWLSPAAASAALYELAAALPDGFERREIGRRVLQRMRQGDAGTFVSVATLLAQGSPRALSGPQIRARVALSLDLPIGLGAQVDSLALALISRRDLQREWLIAPSIGSLPSRRLAARLLERAAREAARQATAGDETGVQIFGTQPVKLAWDRLLAERESLVWRHVAVARGLLSVAVPQFAEEIDQHLDPNLTPTEWRRAAASIAGAIAAMPDEAVNKGRAMLDGPLTKLDRGVASAMIFGLPRASEVEPQAVEELLETLIQVGSVASVESLVELRRERLGESFAHWASKLAREHLREAAAAVKGVDDGKSALVEALDAELRSEMESAEPTLRDRLTLALDAFASMGSQRAYEEALKALEAARSTLTFLEECQGDDSHSRRWQFRALRELDTGLLETATLSDLLTLGKKSSEAAGPLNELFGRLTRWLIQRESAPLKTPGEVPHLSLRLRQLRTLLHLVDADGSYGDDLGEELRQRRLMTTGLLLKRVAEDVPSPLRRTVTAAAARACDALVRDEICEISDVVVATGSSLHDATDFFTLAEASMVPELEAASRAYAKLVEALNNATANSSRGARASLEALLGLAEELPLASSRRVEALRTALRGLVATLQTVDDATSLRELAEAGEAGPLLRLEVSTKTLAQLVVGALRRLELDASDEPPQCGAAIRLIDFSLERALRGSRPALDEALRTASELLSEELPTAIAEVAHRILKGLDTLPLEPPAHSPKIKTKTRSIAPQRTPLPPWLPPGRTIGGFFVLRALGMGSSASVFVVKRLEERSSPHAEKLALKVPEYDGSAALTLSEDQFLHLFREEAGALLALPQHPNLARFVTFDAGAKPKPILVMELVEGPSLERVFEMKDLTIERAFSLIDGIAAGLEGMHAVGVGHLDLKPSNVILRSSPKLDKAPEVPVLVDLGLAGRKVRPGCGTPNYAAPEVWGLVPPRHRPSPLDIDVYAFGCLAYEVLTGSVLFDAKEIGGFQSAHISHDGNLAAIKALADDSSLAPLSKLLRATLRQDPRNRPPITTIRKDFAKLGRRFAEMAWPLGGPDLNDDTTPTIRIPL